MVPTAPLAALFTAPSPGRNDPQLRHRRLDRTKDLNCQGRGLWRAYSVCCAPPLFRDGARGPEKGNDVSRGLQIFARGAQGSGLRVEAAERAVGSSVCRTSILQRVGASMYLERRGAGGARARGPAAAWNQNPDGRTPAPRPGALAAWCTAPPSGTPRSSHAARSQARRSPDQVREFQGSSPPRQGPGRGRQSPALGGFPLAAESAGGRFPRSLRQLCGRAARGRGFQRRGPRCGTSPGRRLCSVAAVTGAHTRSRDDGVQAGGEGKRT